MFGKDYELAIKKVKKVISNSKAPLEIVSISSSRLKDNSECYIFDIEKKEDLKKKQNGDTVDFMTAISLHITIPTNDIPADSDFNFYLNFFAEEAKNTSTFDINEYLIKDLDESIQNLQNEIKKLEEQKLDFEGEDYNEK